MSLPTAQSIPTTANLAPPAAKGKPTMTADLSPGSVLLLPSSTGTVCGETKFQSSLNQTDRPAVKRKTNTPLSTEQTDRGSAGARHKTPRKGAERAVFLKCR